MGYIVQNFFGLGAFNLRKLVNISSKSSPQ